MISLRLNKNIETDIKNIATIMKTNKATLLREAITNYIEDMKDYILAMESIKDIETLEKQGKKATYTLEEIKEKYKDVL